MTTRIVVTGASGNVGTAVLRQFTETADHELVGIVRRQEHSRGSAVDVTSEDLARRAV